MHRHFYARLLRFDRPAPDARRGFTLVELLVVIAIIGMLVALLIPAVMSAREAGRRAQCLNNQKQIGTAVINYTTEKNKFPPLFTLQPPMPAAGDPIAAVGWVPTMLPFLEQTPLYQVFQANNWSTLLNAEVATLVCPSRNPTFSPAPLSYIVNAGMTDVFRDGQPLDYRENGVFFDDFAWRMRSISSPKPPTIDMAYLTRHDGNSMTFMLSESLNATDWIGVAAAAGTIAQPTYMANIPVYPTPFPLGQPDSWWASFTWRNDNPPELPSPPPPFGPNWGMTGVFPTGQVLNREPPPTVVLAAGDWESLDFYLGRPSSNHPGGFIVTMCDGHSQFMSEDIEYRVYCLLAAPNNANAKLPLNGNAVQYPADWYGGGVITNPLRPVTEADLNP